MAWDDGALYHRDVRIRSRCGENPAIKIYNETNETNDRFITAARLTLTSLVPALGCPAQRNKLGPGTFKNLKSTSS